MKRNPDVGVRKTASVVAVDAESPGAQRGSALPGFPRQRVTRPCSQRPPAGFLLLLVLCLLAPLRVAAQDSFSERPLLLTTARQVHDLSPNLAPKARVHLTGTLTYYDVAERAMFLQDATGGVYIDTDRMYPVREGDVVSVEGYAAESYRTEVALDPGITVVSAGHQLPAPRADYTALIGGALDCKLATIRGTVRAINVEQHQNAPILHIDINMPGGAIEVYQPLSVLVGDKVPDYAGLNGSSLLDTTVDVTGVVGGAFDTKSQLTGVILYAQRSSAIRVIHRANVTALQLPLTSMDDVFQSRRILDTSSRLRLRGVLTFYKKGDSAVLEQNGKTIFVLTRETKNIPLGEIVDAVGFASDQEYAPSLRQAELFDTGRSRTILPKPTTFDEVIGGFYSDNLVSLDGTLVSELHGTGSETVVMEVDGHLVTGRLDGPNRLADLRPGTRVRLIGICRVVPGGPWRAPTLFHIAMRSQADLTMLSAPSWWTIKHLMGLLGTLVVLVLTAAIWAMLLRRRVRQQTARIERTMLIAKRRSELLEKISSNLSAETLLQEVCTCVMDLLPGTTCVYVFDAPSVTETMSAAPQPAEHAVMLYSMALTGAGDKPVGRLSVSTTSPRLDLGNRYEVFGMMSEVADLAMRQSLLYQGLIHHSTHDSLTDLPNRRLCEDRLRIALNQAAQQHTSVAILYIDVNRFKHVNDKFGHRIGDLYLKAISSRLLEEIRSSDTLARIGGDEFLIIAPQTTLAGEAADLSRRLHLCFDRPFLLDGIRIEGSASFGMASYPEHGLNAEELERYADQAMYLAKRRTAIGAGHGDLPEINILTPDELELALERDQFRLAYQPQFSADGQLRGMEALLRLEDSILGTLTPDAFISVAERSDAIIPLGRWVIETAMRDAVKWGLHLGPAVLLVVNVAMRQVIEADFVETIFSLLDQTGFPIDRLELELTERTLATDCNEVKERLEGLRTAGVRISLDDFGTGQSSLSLLHRLPIDTIKIDRSFITAMEKEPNVLPVIQAITYMAKSLNKRVVAEGMETTAPIPALLGMGEMDFQGYLLSRPVPAAQILQVLPSWRSGLRMPPDFLASRDRTLQPRELGENPWEGR